MIMKTRMMILLVVLLFGSERSFSQTSYSTTGGWVNVSNPSYVLTIADLHFAVANIINGNVNPFSWYTLPSGTQYQMLHPQEWFSLLVQCYQVRNSSVTKNNILSAIDDSEILYWTDDISEHVKNFFWSPSKNGVDFIHNYTGIGIKPLIPVIVHGGGLTMKGNCWNPLMGYYTPQPKPEQKTQPKQIPATAGTGGFAGGTHPPTNFGPQGGGRGGWAGGYSAPSNFGPQGGGRGGPAGGTSSATNWGNPGGGTGGGAGGTNPETNWGNPGGGTGGNAGGTNPETNWGTPGGGTGGGAGGTNPETNWSNPGGGSGGGAGGTNPETPFGLPGGGIGGHYGPNGYK
jgi:hypothetical protein